MNIFNGDPIEELDNIMIKSGLNPKTKMNKYQKYTDLRTQIAELSEELKTIGDEIFTEANDNNGTLENEYGQFKCVYREKWEFSSDYKANEKAIKLKLKSMQENEKVLGKATKISDGGYLKFTAKKD